MINALITFAEFLIVGSYLSTSFLTLRVLAALAMTLYVIAGFAIGYTVEGMISLIFFSALEAIINYVQIFRILKDTSAVFLPEHIRKIYKTNFSIMKNREFVQIYKLSAEISYNKGDLIVQKGTEIPV